jgi:hypothetical protein
MDAKEVVEDEFLWDNDVKKKKKEYMSLLGGHLCFIFFFIGLDGKCPLNIHN